MRTPLPGLIAFALIVTLSGASALAQSPPVDVTGAVEQTLTADRQVYPLGAPVDFTFTVRNTSDQPVTFTFPSTKQWDLWIVRGDRRVFTLSKGMIYAQVITEFTLQPDEAKTFTARWMQVDDSGKQVGPGVYDVCAQLTPTGPAPPPAALRIQIGVATSMAVPTTVRQTLSRYDALHNRTIEIEGAYHGIRPVPGDANTSPGQPLTTSDWVICDNTGCMYVNGPSALSPLEDMGRDITVTGRLRQTAAGQVFIVLEDVTVAQR